MNPYYDQDGITIYHGDCREVMLHLHEGLTPPWPCLESCVTDPPYGDTSLAWDDIAGGWISVLSTVMPSTSGLWMFTSLRHLLAMVGELEGWRLAEEIVWEKHNGTNLLRDRFRRVHELAVHFYRGDWGELYHEPPRAWQPRSRVVRKQSRPAQWLGTTGATTFVQPAGMTKIMRSVIYARSEHRRGHHPTQKPLAVVRPLVESSTRPGGLVLDPFMGSGTTLVAARECGRRAIGIERDERYCELAATRVQQGSLDLAATATQT